MYVIDWVNVMNLFVYTLYMYWYMWDFPFVFENIVVRQLRRN